MIMLSSFEALTFILHLIYSKKIKLAKQQIATSAQRSQNIKKKLSSLQQKSLFPSTKQSNSSSKETKVTGAVTIGLKESSLGIDESSTTTENGKGLLVTIYGHASCFCFNPTHFLLQ